MLYAVFVDTLAGTRPYNSKRSGFKALKYEPFQNEIKGGEVEMATDTIVTMEEVKFRGFMSTFKEKERERARKQCP